MALSKKLAEEEKPQPFEEPTPESDAVLDRAIDKFGETIEELGYTEFDFELVETPFETNRGKLLAKGVFTGPSPFAGSSRAPEDLSQFAFNILYDSKFDETFIEVKHESAFIATYQIQDGGIKLIDGEIPHV